MSWHFEDLRAHKHQGGLLFNYISIGMVFYFCFLKGRSIALGRERARCTAMNHSILFPLINDPNSAIKQKQKMTCKNCVDDIKRKQVKKNHLSVQNMCSHHDADLIHNLAKPFL